MSLKPGNRNGSSLNLLAKVETLSILYAAVFLTRIGFGTILVIFPTYLSISSYLLGVILALYPALEGLSALPVGAWIDRSGRRKAFIIGMALITVLTAVISLTRTSIPLVGGAHALMGLAAAMVTISSLTMITDLTTVENRGAGMGAFDLANLSGYGVGVISGTLLAKLFVQSVGTIFQIVAGVFAAATVFALLALREPPHISTGQEFSIESPGAMFKEVSGSFGEMASIYPLWFSLTIIIGFYFFLPKIAAGSSFSLSSSAGLVVIAAGLIALGAGALLFGRISDKIGRTRTILIGAFGELGFLLLFPDLFQRLVQVPETASLIDELRILFRMLGYQGLIAGILFFMGSALVPSILAFVGDKAGREFRGKAMGIYSLMLSAGIATGNVLAGVFDTLGGVQAVFYSAAIIFGGLGLVSGALMNPPLVRKFFRRMFRIFSLGFWSPRKGNEPI
jgi:MFS family permease